MDSSLKGFFSFIFGGLFVYFLVYGIIHFLNIDLGRLVDWGVAVAAVNWIFIILTFPWNAHFRAKEVLDDAQISKRKDILVIEETLSYAKKVAKNSLIIAISLHLVSGIGLYLIAFFEISPVGYYAAGAAILLTALRPSARYYDYLQRRLNSIQQEFRYPREDLRELLNKVDEINYRLKEQERLLSIEPNENSWRKEVDNQFNKQNKWNEKTINEMGEKVKKLSTEIEKVRDESQSSIEKITSDSKVLDSVRELVAFFKKA